MNETFWAIAIPSVIALLGSVAGYILLRRSSKEQNDTNSFKVVTDQLFQLNKDLRTEIDGVKAELVDVKASVQTKENENKLLKVELEKTQIDLRDSRMVSHSLALYVRQLISEWVGPTPPPTPNPPIDWKLHIVP